MKVIIITEVVFVIPTFSFLNDDVTMFHKPHICFLQRRCFGGGRNHFRRVRIPACDPLKSLSVRLYACNNSRATKRIFIKLRKRVQ